MKILVIHNRYHTNLFNWFRGFLQNGHEVRLLVYKSDKVAQPDLPKSDSLPPSKWSIKKMRKNPRTRGDGVDSFSPYYYPSFKSLYNYFKREKPDLVIIRPAFSRFAYLALLMTFFFGAKRVFYSQIRIHRQYTIFKKAIFNLSMFIMNAHWMSPCLGDNVSYPKAPKRMVYFPFAMPILAEVERSYTEGNKVNILSVAKYFQSKNPLLVLEAFLFLCEEFDHIYLTICGSGDEKGAYYQEMCKIVSLSRFKERINLLINRPYTEVQQLYQSHDFFILPSRHDPAAITNLEAMAFGLPIICSSSNGTASYTSHGQNGYIFDVSQKEQLVSYMKTLISNKHLLNGMGADSLNVVSMKHNPERVTNEFLKRIIG